jgi:hypothetical protein
VAFGFHYCAAKLVHKMETLAELVEIEAPGPVSIEPVVELVNPKVLQCVGMCVCVCVCVIAEWEAIPAPQGPVILLRQERKLPERQNTHATHARETYECSRDRRRQSVTRSSSSVNLIRSGIYPTC